MLMCPKCRNEYRDGIENCADCGCKLVAVNENGNMVPLVAGERASLENIMKYLEYNKVSGAQLMYDGTKAVHVLVVPQDSFAQARKYAANYMQQEQARRQEEMMKANVQAGAFAVPQEEGEKPKQRMYMDNKVRAEENRSSAWTLLLVGGVGIVFVVLGFFGFLPIHISGPSRYMIFGLMGAMFLLFFVMGIVSLRNSKTYASKAKEDNELENTLKEWCQEAFANGVVDTMLGLEIMDASSEELYFKRTALMKAMIAKQFVNLDNTFVDHFVDEMYDELFS